MSESNLEQLRKRIEDQQRVIQFFQSQFKEQTGNHLALPSSWSQFLKIEDEEAPISDQKQTIETMNTVEENHDGFIQAFYKLNLPQKRLESQKKKKGFAPAIIVKGSILVTAGRGNKRNPLTTTFDQNNPNHMIQAINLSGFEYKVDYC